MIAGGLVIHPGSPHVQRRELGAVMVSSGLHGGNGELVSASGAWA